MISSIFMQYIYDHVNWKFLLSVLKKMKFDLKKWIGWIKWCTTFAKFYVIVNYSLFSLFQNQRVRQGDLLSPYVFVVAMEALNCLLKRTRKGSYLLRVRMRGRNGEREEVSHLLLADDTLVF